MRGILRGTRGRRRNEAVALLSAEAAHHEHPRTYSIPRLAVREALRPGDLVKLLFEVEPPVRGIDVERMWVEVVAVEGSAYRGHLATKPEYLTSLRPGDEVIFRPEHIAARSAGTEDPLWIDPAAFAVVSRRVWEQDAWPGRLERQPIPDASFSGWIVLAGDETDDVMADPANFLPLTQAALFERFPVLDAGLEGPVGTTMLWDDVALEYREAPSSARR